MSPSKVSTVDWDSFHNIIDGQLASAKENHHGVNPVTGEELWPVPVATQQDVDRAVQAGQKAFKSWRNVPLEERRDALKKWCDLLEKNREQLTELLCKEVGRPRQFCDMEVSIVIGTIMANTGIDLPVERIEDDTKILTTRYFPMGVCAAICPWNFPLILSLGKVAPATVTGNVIIVKPSPFTPYSLLKCVELAQEAFPPGVVQALGGDDKLGPMLTAHPDIQRIAFTGSIATGKKIMAACANTLKRVTLELGGNDASIILPDVDIQKVAPEVVLGAFQNSGQVCVATKRIYVHESIYRPFVDAMVAFTAHLKTGDALDPSVSVGPVQNKMQYENVKGLVNDSREKGYKFLTGEQHVQEGKGYFIQPTIIDNPPSDSRIVQEEPFGPIVPVQPWSDEAEVIERANASNCGLGACVWSKDVARAEKIGQQLEAGTVWINSWEKPDPRGFFSGFKESGPGGEYGVQGLMTYCNAQCMHTWKTEV